MVTNRSRAYPIRSGKDVFEKDISVFGFEGITPLELIRYSSLAQSVEHLTVNQGVVGSSPTGGAMAPWSSG